MLLDKRYKRSPQQPFPYFGGKRRVAEEVWRRFGNVRNYVEPFCGGCGMLLGRKDWKGKIETVNDIHCLLVNFWRAVRMHPLKLSEACRYPVSELDIIARNRWLIRRQADIRAQIVADEKWCDVETAAWWVWGQCAHIGPDWCTPKLARPGAASQPTAQMHLANGGRGVFREPEKRLPYLSAPRNSYCLTVDLHAYFEKLSARLLRVRICCGEWGRVLTPAVTWRLGMTGVFLDPPYTFLAGRRGGLYAHDDQTLGFDVRDWAVENGGNPQLRIALCGYDGEYDMPANWKVHAWQSRMGKGPDERVWFSPHCQG